MHEGEDKNGKSEALRAFKERMIEIKRREMEKKAAKQKYDPHFDDIDPNCLEEEDRLAYENLATMSDEEFSELRQRRLADKEPLPENLEDQIRGLTRAQQERIRGYVSSHSMWHRPETPVEKSLSSFWQFLTNARVDLENRRSKENL